MQSIRVIFEGRVQGVGFRYEVKQIALGYDVVGWVKNLPDGSVELHISGEKEEVEEFMQEITEESAMARNISNVDSYNEPLPENTQGFVIATN